MGSVHLFDNFTDKKANDLFVEIIMKNLSNKKMAGQEGFSLVELMIVVAIIGLLAALALPRFETFKIKALQSEAKTSLGHLNTLQAAYFGENSKYAALTATGNNQNCSGNNVLGYAINNCANSVYAVSATTSNGDLNYASLASGKPDPKCAASDEWTSSDTGAIAKKHDVTTDGCTSGGSSTGP